MSEESIGRRNVAHALTELRAAAKTVSDDAMRRRLWDAVDRLIFALRQIGWHTTKGEQ